MEISRFVTEAWTKNENVEHKLKRSYSKNEIVLNELKEKET